MSQMKGFKLSAQKAPQPDIPQVSVDVISGIPGVQAMIAQAQSGNKEEKAGLDYGDDVAGILQSAGPLLEQAIPGISAAMEALMGSVQGQKANAAGTSLFGMSRKGVKG